MEFDFTNDILERILVKKSLTDKCYLKKMSSIFEERWLTENKNLAIIESLAIRYFNKSDKIPTNKFLNLAIDKYSESHEFDASQAKSELLNLDNLDIDVTSEITRDNLKNFVEKKALYYSIVDNANDIMKTGNVDKCLSRFEKARTVNSADENIGMSYFKSDDMKKHWDFMRNPEARISTGWCGLDTYTNGGFYKDGRCLVCFMGQAGLGKSLFLSNITVNFLKQNLSVAVISLEMSEDIYAQRFDAHISECEINSLGKNYLHAIPSIEKFHEKYPNANLFIKEYPPRTIRCRDVEMYLDNLIAAGNHFDVIVVDYLNLLLPNEKIEGMYQSIGSVAEKLRAMSYKYNVPVITATQTNGEGINNSNIGMEHVSESKMIVHTVDGFYGLYRSNDDQQHGQIGMKILKNRFGGQVGANLKFSMNKENLILTDISMKQGSEIDDEDDNSEADNILNNFQEFQNDLNN